MAAGLGCGFRGFSALDNVSNQQHGKLSQLGHCWSRHHSDCNPYVGRSAAMPRLTMSESARCFADFVIAGTVAEA
jgi:hypothetical protein